MDASAPAPRAGRARRSRQTVLMGIRRLPRSRGPRDGIQAAARRARDRHGIDDGVSVGAGAKYGGDHRASSGREVLHRSRGSGRGVRRARRTLRRVDSMTNQPLLARLLDPERIVLFDGAMGTMLYQRGVFINQCYDELSVRSPELVGEIHRQYVKAGAEVLETNSFGANRVKLAQYGLEGQVQAINRGAAAIARGVADEAAHPVLVAGAVGPLGVRLEPYGPTSEEEARAVFREQLAALREGGADLFILETFSDLHEIKEAIRAAREVDATTPIVAQMTIGADHHRSYGPTAEDVARRLDEWGSDVIGLNCSVGPQIILECIERMATVTRRKLSAQPNAGMPRDVGGRSMYMASPEYMATYARHLIHAGAKVLGGCCGTTPEHIKAICEGIRPLNPRLAAQSAPPRVTSGESTVASDSISPATRHSSLVTPFAQRSRFASRIGAGEFVTSVEIVPPRGVDATRMITDVRKLKDAGVDAVNVPDGPRAQSRMGALLTSVLIEQQVGIETVTHYACRCRPAVR